ncbi:MAG: aminopeptidase P N-terminal domain-containing protein [Bacteroidetes bacterium]|nr:aminopeptidase P N-terminal domain-containing protein [Bacteroidota bacterium]
MRHGFSFLFIWLMTFSLYSQDCERPGIIPGEIFARRNALLHLMDSTSALVMKAEDADYDADIDPYRQSPDFFNLTGIDEPGYKLIVTPVGYKFGSGIKHILIFTYPDQMSEPLLLSASDTLLDEKFFEPLLSQIYGSIKTLYYYPLPKLSNDWLNSKTVISERETKKVFELAHPGVKLKSATKLFTAIRQVKTGQETELIKKAIAMTGDGIISAMKQCKPGMHEYELQAIIEYEAKRQGAQCMAFASIIGSGVNSLSPHYEKNICRMNEGDLVVMDVGARYGEFCADITRTIPVSGKFTADQEIIYQAVLDIQKAVIDMIRPGITLGDLDRKTTQLTRKAGYVNYMLHSVTHPVGLVVHDVASGDTLLPGMIITVEPGIYIPLNDTVQPLKRRGFGIRIEDDILVTADGHELLSKGIPKEIAEIGKLMRRKK